SAAIGLAVVEGKLGYFPKSDGILFADQLHQFAHVLRYSKRMVATVKAAYILSLVYNLTGVVLALLGHLSPVIAAVLMPLSSISVVLFVVLFAWGFAPKD
ncbi:MAG: heavy metal translocating P-type ATPase, partial [Schleiferiaceae bacterium]